MAHITVERNRRRLMNDNLKALRSLTPSFYIQRGDQASIIGGVIEFIKELHQIQQSLESNKRRKSLSRSPSPSPKPLLQQYVHQDHQASSRRKGLFGCENSDDQNSNVDNIISNAMELGAICNSSIADVEAKMSGGSNVVLRTVSRRIPSQLLKIISVLEKLSFEILHLNISSMEDTVLYTFVLKIGLECPVSVEELALEVQQSFCSDN